MNSVVSTTGADTNRPPCVFLSHASEDNELAKRIAEDFQLHGINTFFDGWEIGPGDSFRQKIDAGLVRCTHFVVLLTQSSIEKPWVNAEMDAGFVKKISGSSKFIPLRYGLSADVLPPLLTGIYSPELTEYENDVQALIHYIHGVTSKPPLGGKLPVIQHTNGSLGLSRGAEVIARLMIEQSEHGNAFDPQIMADDLHEKTGLVDDDIVDAVDELSGLGFVRKHVTMGCGRLGFRSITPEAALFTELDKHFNEWNAEADALRVAADLENGATEGILSVMAEKYGWRPRRINPAVNYLIERNLVDASRGIGTFPWSCHWIYKNDKTRRFVRDRSSEDR